MSGTSSSRSHTSSVTLKSAMSMVEKIPKTKTCPWVAQWFTLPQAIVKGLELMVGIVAVVLMLLWRSEGISIADLDEGTVNFRNTLYTYIGVAFLTTLYAVGMIIVGLGGLQFPSILQTTLSGVLLFAWTLSAPVASASLQVLNDSLFARSRDLDILYLQLANGFGFLLIGLFLADILMAFMGLNSLDDDSKQIQLELEQSRSTMMAVRSGKSLDEVRKTNKKTKTKRVSSKERPVDEKSPLKSHEEGSIDSHVDELAHSAV